MEISPSDLSDEEWTILEPLIPPEKPGGRPREVEMRAVLNGIFYVLRAGCAWRMIPRDYPPKSTVYSYFAHFLKYKHETKVSVRELILTHAAPCHKEHTRYHHSKARTCAPVAYY